MINRDLSRLNEEWSPGRAESVYSPPPAPAPPAAEPGEEADVSDMDREELLAEIAALRARAERERQRAETAEFRLADREDGLRLVVRERNDARRETERAVGEGLVALRERDEAREQLAAERRRADEEHTLRLSMEGRLCMDKTHADLRSRLATAEAEVARLRAEQADREHLDKLVAAAGNEVARRENAALRQRCERLVVAGDEMVGCRARMGSLCGACRNRWDAAARGEKGGA